MDSFNPVAKKLNLVARHKSRKSNALLIPNDALLLALLYFARRPTLFAQKQVHLQQLESILKKKTTTQTLFQKGDHYEKY